MMDATLTNVNTARHLLSFGAADGEVRSELISRGVSAEDAFLALMGAKVMDAPDREYGPLPLARQEYVVIEPR